MKKKILVLSVAALVFTACQNNANQNQEQELSSKVIEVHDDIMPMIHVFDKATLEIDSILVHLPQIKESNVELDTTSTRDELATLRVNLEKATEDMMSWMREYNLDSADLDYQESELKKITEMRDFFTVVNEEKDSKLHLYQ